MQYDEAITQLFRAPHADFVAERKRLAAEIKKGGDKDGAARLAKLGRPPISAWAVNQLWWEARAPFDEMLATAKKIREGDLGAMPDHRAALATLRERAAEILTAAGNAAADPTIRRIQMTLSAIAASGGFEPDPPGALTEDRDPPGFAALGIPSGPAVAPAPEPSQKKSHLKAVPDQEEEPAEQAKARHAEAKAAAKAKEADEKAREAEEKAAAKAEAAEEKSLAKAREAEEKAAAKAKEAAERAREAAEKADAKARADERAREADEKTQAKAREADEEAAEAQTRKDEAQAEVDRLRAETERLEDELSTARADLKAAERHLAKLK